MKKLFSNLLTSFVSIIILLLVLEVLVRAFVPEENYTLTATAADWAADSILGWKNKADYEDVTVRHGEMITYRTNYDGFRPYDALREKAADEVRVMLFGNSTVAARDVLEECTIHAFLDSMLDLSGRNYNVINAGVQGYSTDQAFLSMHQQINIYNPDVVVYGYCVNDLYANISGEYSGLYKPFFTLEGDSLKFHPLEKKNNEILKTTANYSYKDILQKSAFYGLIRPFIQQIRIEYSEQAQLDQGGINDLGRYLKPWSEDKYFQVFSMLLVGMNQLCQEHHADFFLYGHPELVTVWEPYSEIIGVDNPPYKIIENRLEEIAAYDSVCFVGMVDHFLENKEKGPFHLIPRDPHCNRMGYYLQAEVLTDYIKYL